MLLASGCLQVVSDEPGSYLPDCSLGAASPGVTTLYPGVLSQSMAPSDDPAGLALGADCSLYVADSTEIRRVDPAGNVTTVVASSTTPTDDINAINPGWLAIDATGNLYIADPSNDRICKLDRRGNLTTLAGNGQPGFADGTGGPNGSSSFNNPVAVAVDPDGNVYVADSTNSRIRRIDTSGNVTTFAGNGKYGPQDGTAGPTGSAEFFGPAGVAVDGIGNVYVADTLNQRICKIDSSGNVTTLAGGAGARAGGYQDGTGGPAGAARFSGPTGLAAQWDGTVYVADTGNRRIRRIDGAGNVTTLAGGQSQSMDGTLGPTGTAGFFELSELILDGNGNLYANDDDAVRKVVP